MRKYIICFALISISAASEAPFWINVADCPLEMREDRSYFQVSNNSPKNVAEFRIGCINHERGQWEIGKIVENRKVSLDAKKGNMTSVNITSLEAMKDLHFKCKARYWLLGIVRVSFNDKTIWDLNQQQKKNKIGSYFFSETVVPLTSGR
jgi:hypothetical protein